MNGAYSAKTIFTSHTSIYRSFIECTPDPRWEILNGLRHSVQCSQLINEDVPNMGLGIFYREIRPYVQTGRKIDGYMEETGFSLCARIVSHTKAAWKNYILRPYMSLHLNGVCYLGPLIQNLKFTWWDLSIDVWLIKNCPNCVHPISKSIFPGYFYIRFEWVWVRTFCLGFGDNLGRPFDWGMAIPKWLWLNTLSVYLPSHTCIHFSFWKCLHQFVRVLCVPPSSNQTLFWRQCL